MRNFVEDSVILVTLVSDRCASGSIPDDSSEIPPEVLTRFLQMYSDFFYRDSPEGTPI